jgi:quercetin dioxygenase-like cupin family protein
MKTIARRTITLVTLAAFGTVSALAQAPGIKRTLLQRSDVSADREVILGHAEIAPGSAAGRHTHFGVEAGYVLEGTTSLEIEGETPKLLKRGDSYLIPAGKVHDAKTVGDVPAKVLATYVVEKGKPLATPAP